MTDDFGPFRPLSAAEREAAAQETARARQPDAARPALPPPGAEVPEGAATRLFRRAPDASWRYHGRRASLLRLPVEQAGRQGH
jgi:hypothetical protein